MNKHQIQSSIEILEHAHFVLSAGPEYWTQGACGRNEHGQILTDFTTNPDAVSFCAYGAMRMNSNEWSGLACAENLLGEVTGADYIADYNDKTGRKHKTILNTFEKAIALGYKKLAGA